MLYRISISEHTKTRLELTSSVKTERLYFIGHTKWYNSYDYRIICKLPSHLQDTELVTILSNT